MIKQVQHQPSGQDFAMKVVAKEKVDLRNKMMSDTHSIGNCYNLEVA
jgi:hypothetical protein